MAKHLRTVKRSEVSNAKMVSSGEKRLSVIIDKGRVLEWVGIGWVDIGKATQSDIERWPTVID